MTYFEAWNIPFGELSDLTAVEQIKKEGAKEKKSNGQDGDKDFWEIMKLK